MFSRRMMKSVTFLASCWVSDLHPVTHCRHELDWFALLSYVTGFMFINGTNNKAT